MIQPVQVNFYTDSFSISRGISLSWISQDLAAE